MYLSNRRFFKKRFKLSSVFTVKKNTIYSTVLKLRPFFFKSILKKVIKLSKKSKVRVFVCFKKNLIVSKKSKNSRMGKGKGSNIYKFSFLKNTLFSFYNTSKTRFFKVKKKLNYFLKNKIKSC
jgi:hypothetical protein